MKCENCDEETVSLTKVAVYESQELCWTCRSEYYKHLLIFVKSFVRPLTLIDGTSMEDYIKECMIEEETTG